MGAFGSLYNDLFGDETEDRSSPLGQLNKSLFGDAADNPLGGAPLAEPIRLPEPAMLANDPMMPPSPSTTAQRGPVADVGPGSMPMTGRNPIAVASDPMGTAGSAGPQRQGVPDQFFEDLDHTLESLRTPDADLDTWRAERNAADQIKAIVQVHGTDPSQWDGRVANMAREALKQNERIGTVPLKPTPAGEFLKTLSRELDPNNAESRRERATAQLKASITSEEKQREVLGVANNMEHYLFSATDAEMRELSPETREYVESYKQDTPQFKIAKELHNIQRDPNAESHREAMALSKRLVEKLPFIGSGPELMEAGAVLAASKRIEAGKPWKNDYRRMAEFIYANQVAAEEARDNTWLQKAGQLVEQLPTFMFEFMATGGIANVAKEGIKRGLTKAVTRGTKEAVESRAGQIAVGTVAELGAAGAQAAMMPAGAVANTNRLAANAAVENLLNPNKPPKDASFLGNLAAGTTSHYIEVLSERIGGKLMSGAGTAAGKLTPEAIKKLGAVPAVQAVRGWVSGSGKLAEKAGFHGGIEEFAEERFVDAANGILGNVSDYFDARGFDYGASGSAAKLESEGIKQLGAELFVFGLLGGAQKAGQAVFEKPEAAVAIDKFLADPSRRNYKNLPEDVKTLRPGKQNAKGREGLASTLRTAITVSQSVLDAQAQQRPTETQQASSVASGETFAQPPVQSPQIPAADAGVGTQQPMAPDAEMPYQGPQVVFDPAAERERLAELTNGELYAMEKRNMGLPTERFKEWLLREPTEVPPKQSDKVIDQAVERMVASPESVESDVDFPFGANAPGSDALFGNSSNVPTSSTGEGQTVSTEAILRRMEKDFDVPLRLGRIPNAKAAGIYKTRARIVRLKGQYWGNLGVAAHEIAHHIDQTTDIIKTLSDSERKELQALDYKKTRRWSKEGFAEFVRHYLTEDDAATVAPEFHAKFEQWLSNNPELQGKVTNAKRLIDQWRQAAPAARVGAQVAPKAGPAEETVGEKAREAAQTTWNQFLTRWSDRLHGFRIFDEAVAKSGRQLKEGETGTYAIAMATNMTATSHTERALEGGVETVSEDHRKLSEGGLAWVMESVEPGQDYDNWITFAYARHALETYENNPSYNPGITEEDALRVVTDIESNPELHDRYLQASERLTSFNNALIDMLADAGVLTEADATRMKEAWETYIPLERVKSGKAASKMFANAVDLPKPVKSRSRYGSGLPIVDPVQATIGRAMRFYDIALKQQVVLEVVKQGDPSLGGGEGLGALIEHVDPNMKSTQAKLETLISQMVNSGLIDSDYAKLVRQVNRLRQGKISQRDINSLSEKYGLDNESDTIVEELVDATSDVADLQSMIAIWKPDFRAVPSENIARVVVNGESRLYQLDPFLYEAVENLSPPSYNLFVKSLGTVTDVFKTFTVGINPIFQANNVVRDWRAFQENTQYSENVGSVGSPFYWTAMFVKSELEQRAGKKGNEVINLYREFGGEVQTRLGHDAAAMERARRRLLSQGKKGHGVHKTLDTIKHPMDVLDKVRNAMSFAEYGPRVAEFYGVLRANGYELDTETGQIINSETKEARRPPRHVLIEAINAASDVTTNFKKQGSHAKVVNRVIPFFTAGLSSLNKKYRVYKGAIKGEKGWQRVAVSVALGATAGVMQALMRGDDDDYKEEAAFLKYGYWTYTDENGKPMYRIPKGYEESWVPNLAEAITNEMNPEVQSGFKDMMFQQMEKSLPGHESPVATPILESMMNYSFFRERPIESRGLERLPVEQRAYAYTPEFWKKFSEVFGKHISLSPVKAQHIFSGMSGGADRPIGFGKRLAESLVARENKMESRDAPFTIARDYARSIDDFYDKNERVTQSHLGAKAKTGKEDPELSAEASRLGVFSDMLSDLGDLSRGTRDRDKRFEVEKYRIGLARFALGRNELERYPNPLTDKNAPESVQKIANHRIGASMYAASAPGKDGKSSDKEKAESQAQRAADFIKSLDLKPNDAVKQLESHMLAELNERRRKNGVKWEYKNIPADSATFTTFHDRKKRLLERLQ